MTYNEVITYNLKGYYKIIDTISSCEILNHMEGCTNMINSYINKLEFNIKQLWKEFFKHPTYKNLKNIFKYKKFCNLMINDLVEMGNEKIRYFRADSENEYQYIPKIQGFVGDE